jgi:hypothetical protein
MRARLVEGEHELLVEFGVTSYRRAVAETLIEPSEPEEYEFGDFVVLEFNGRIRPPGHIMAWRRLDQAVESMSSAFHEQFLAQIPEPEPCPDPKHV